MFRGCDVLLTDEDLLTAEAEIGLRLPNPFKEHYRRCNGGIPSRTYYTNADAEVTVSSYIPLVSAKGRRTIVDDYRHLVLGHRVAPVELVPFANLVCGDLLFVDTSTLDGDVVLWRHDTAFEDDRLRSLGVGFDTFLDSLREKRSE